MDNNEILKVNDGEEVGMDAADKVTRRRIWCGKKGRYVDGTGCENKLCGDCDDAEDKRP